MGLRAKLRLETSLNGLITFSSSVSSLEEVEEDAQLGLILVWALPNIKKKSGRELRFLVNIEAKTQNSRLCSEKAVQYGDTLLHGSWEGRK